MFGPEIGQDDFCHPGARRTPFTAEGWQFELKHDGFRTLARRTEAGVQLLSRSGRSLAAAFPELVDDLACQPCALVLDGELVLPDAEGRSDFPELRRRALLQQRRSIEQAALRAPAVLVVFDVLYADGVDVRSLPLSHRRQRLCEHVVPRRGIHIIQAIRTFGAALYAAIVEQDHEGIVAKRLDAPYRAGRQCAWVKIKNRNYSRRNAVERQVH